MNNKKSVLSIILSLIMVLSIQNTIESLVNNHLHREMGIIIVTENNTI